MSLLHELRDSPKDGQEVEIGEVLVPVLLQKPNVLFLFEVILVLGGILIVLVILVVRIVLVSRRLIVASLVLVWVVVWRLEHFVPVHWRR